MTRVLDTPFWAIYNILSFILYKDLHATPFQIAVMIALKPLVSLLSMYWSAAINQRRDRLISNIIWARILGYLPFLAFPFISNVWFFIGAFGLYMMLAVGIVPAWMEVLKLNIPSKTREKVFSYTQAFGYMGGGLLPFAIGWMLDGYFQAWRWVFPLCSLMALTALYFQIRILIPPIMDAPPETELKPLKFSDEILKPWKSARDLLLQRPDFKDYQIGFMILGSGLMIMAPALPIYFVDILNLSYTEFLIAATLCKGIGFAIASPVWSRLIHQADIYRFCSWIAGLACLYPLCLMLAKVQLFWLYTGFLGYGIMQAGNELNWNMSGPIFAKNDDSSAYSSLNIIAVGIRGAVIPLAGSLLCNATNSFIVMLIGGALCLYASKRFLTYSKELKTINSAVA